jgi:probable phosphoglycerate mutase
MMRALLLRHAQSTWNEQERWQGWADPPLTATARRAAWAWAADPPAAFDAVMSSDLVRAADTARIIAAALQLGPVEVTAGLREQDQGAWTGLTRADIKRRWPDRLRERPRHPVEGETGAQVLRRVETVLVELAARPDRCILIVTHTGVIREVERRLGCERRPIPHLHGRWIELHGAIDTAVVWTAGEPTAVRLPHATDAASAQ